jgi:hypothetical protein
MLEYIIDGLLAKTFARTAKVFILKSSILLDYESQCRLIDLGKKLLDKFMLCLRVKSSSHKIKVFVKLKVKELYEL